jgi:hypothetical protein
MSTTTHILGRHWSAALVALACMSCVDTASKSNDNAQSAAGASGAATAGAGTGAGAGAGAGGAAAGSSAAGTVARAGAGGAGVSGSAAGSGGMVATGGMSADDDAGVPTAGAMAQAGAPAAGSGAAGTGAAGEPSTAPDPSLVTGTGASCSSYGAPMNGKCGGYFCGVDQATLEKAVDPAAKCGGAVDLLCSNATITAVGNCARQVKSQMPLASNDVLRPMVQDCVYQDAMLKMKVTPDCLACTITAAECAGDKCLAQCLAGDSAGCDSCRKTNNCDQPVFACGGLPSPL